MKYVNIELGRREVRVNSATLKDGRLDVRCCARSRMDAVYVNGSFCIDTDGIVATAVEGLREAGQVDAVTLTGFTGALVVLGENGQMLMPCRALSDPLFDNVEGAPDERRLFDEGGLVPDPRSALYQLLAIRKEEAPLFERARCVMFLIDYIRYRLTGNRACDYSLAQASGLTLAGRREWNAKLFEDLGLVNLFPALAPVDTVLGALSDEIVKEVGYEAQVLSTPANPVELAAYVLRPHMAVTGWLGGRIALFNEGAILSDEVYEAKLVYRTQRYNDLVRTFCMNPNGYVVAENTDGIVTVNGHSYRDPKLHSNNTNFALLVSNTFTEPFTEPHQYGKRIASFSNMLGGGVLLQRFGDLINGRRTNERRLKKSFTKPTLNATPGDLSLVLPKRQLDDIIEMIYALDKIAPGMANADTLLYGVEVKFYSARLELDGRLETKIPNLFACGDGAGITRGLSQASASGVHVARQIGERAKLGK